jgi:cytochrome c556
MRPRIFLATAAIVVPVVTAIAQPADHDGVTLRGIMAELGGEYLRITDAILRDDYDQVAESASAIAHHPMPETLVSAIKKTLGTEFVHFDEIDEASHAAALALHDAASRHDSEAITRQATSLLSKCVECHSGFRTKLRPLSD